MYIILNYYLNGNNHLDYKYELRSVESDIFA